MPGKSERRRWRPQRKDARPSRDGIILKTPHEIAALRRAGRLVAECFELLEEEIAPGVRLDTLDRHVEELIRARGAAPLYKDYRGNPPSHPPFPGVICASVNEEVCHGIPDQRELASGDIVGIDIGLRLDGWCGDACVTFGVGEISDDARRLLEVTGECLMRGIKAARPGGHIGDIGHAIQTHAEANGFSVVRVWGGHGIGRDLHEPPSIPHTGERGQGLPLREGMVFTIEPMINQGDHPWELLEDGWTVVTSDGSLSAQFEHTIAITADGPQILSR